MKKKSLIIDASAVFSIITDDDHRDEICQKADGYEILAPECLTFEICNGISKMMKRGLIPIEQGHDLFRQFKNINLNFIEADYEKVIQIAGEEKHYAYDIFYIENAIKLGIPLLTFDNKLISIAEKRCVKCL